MIMAKFARRRIIFYFFSIVLFIAAMFPVYAGGRQEPELTRADDLIKELRHDEAILLLTDFARRNPRMFDQAQQRLRKIYQTRDEFNRTADTLIDTLIRDPENNERVLALSRHLYTLEHESSPLMINFVARTREIAQFNINRILLRRIMERGRDLLDRGESLAALQTYAEGMSFMREEFFLAGFGQTIEIEVNRETERINAMLASFQQVSTQMGAVSAELLRAINAGETARVPEITSRLNTAMDRFIALKHTVYTSLNSFERTLNAIRAVNPDTGDRNHLSFLSAVIRGRQNESISEGMLGAFDNYWNNSIGSILTGITQNLERSNTTAISALQARNFTAVSSALSNTDYLVNLTPFYFDKHRQLYETGRQPATALYGATILNIDIPRFIEIRALREANGYLVNAAGIASRAAGDGGSFASYQQGTMSAAQALVLEQQTRANIVTMQRSIVELVARADQFHTEINRFHNTMHVFNTARAIENLNRIYTAEGQQSAARFFSISQENLNASIAQRKVQLEKARELLNGESAVAADGTAVVYRYPTEAFAELTALNTAMTNDLQASNAVMEQFRIEQAAGNTDPQIAALRASYQASLNELNSVRDQSTPLTETARTRSSQAEAHRLEGERLFREAQAAFQRRNFDLAIERLNDATGRLDDSLAIQESPPLRQTRDNQIMSLSGAIAEAMNDSVIEEVRTLLGSAQTSYYNGNFQQAESNLVTASNRWRLINSEPHEEVVYWLGIVRIALSATSGRVIPPTAPLYPEMSQLLNQA
ncbi:MAG: hypothetical protein FWD28_08525 [Treponema sp.]|nr:hypothetical protein [Treponema sp.]